MKKIFKKPAGKWIIAALVLLVAGFLVFRFWSASRNTLPKGIGSGNGRIEAELVDIAAKEALRVEKVLVAEGDLVQAGQVLVRLNTATLDAQLAEANANVAAAEKKLAIEKAAIQSRKSEIRLARVEAERSRKLAEANAGSIREYDERRTKKETAMAALKEEEARLQEAEQQLEAARANVATIQTRINDATLVSPVIGRVLYRLIEPGEVLGAGGKALTLVDLSDVYMEIFLPSNQAAAIKMGSEGRVTMDYLPEWVLPAKVSFVSPEAQFTPKQVETKSEREMLMFRVRLQIPNEIVLHYIEQIKTGVRGVGYVKVEESAEWPKRLQMLLTVYQGKVPQGGNQ
jgi:HlyD family secretion protein